MIGQQFEDGRDRAAEITPFMRSLAAISATRPRSTALAGERGCFERLGEKRWGRRALDWGTLIKMLQQRIIFESSGKKRSSSDVILSKEFRVALGKPRCDRGLAKKEGRTAIPPQPN
ncbi:MAG: hypothetical protein HC890_02080 [Chloroflexaceae bacterium]|nr:hypothetical protein [Chloroflexaceae bacterium]